MKRLFCPCLLPPAASPPLSWPRLAPTSSSPCCCCYFSPPLQSAPPPSHPASIPRPRVVCIVPRAHLTRHEHAPSRAPRGAPPTQREREPRAESPLQRWRRQVEHHGAGQRRAERPRGARDEDEAPRSSHGLEREAAGKEGRVPEPQRRRWHRRRRQLVPAPRDSVVGCERDAGAGGIGTAIEDRVEREERRERR